MIHIRLWRERRHNHAWSHLSPQRTQGYLRALGIQPRFVIIASHIPSSQLLAGIKHLTIVFVVATDRSIGSNLPFLIGSYPLGSTIGKLDEEVDATLGVAKGHSLVVLVLTHGEQTAIA